MRHKRHNRDEQNVNENVCLPFKAPMDGPGMDADENGTTAAPPSPTSPPEPVALTNETANETVYTISRARLRDSGHYMCIADQGSGAVRTMVMDVHLRVGKKTLVHSMID